ncbi:MAG TPA: hypothetical protein VK108_11360 [Pseudogracilibacillus sp.]|nr:hypothetical protein [Pseudogracilibacillus sp.]
MASTTIMVSIAILIVSTVGAMGLYFISFNISKKEKKQHLEIVTSYGIQFVIYMWVGKVLVSLPKAIADPLSVLAYPGDSWAFYTATVLTLLHLFIQSKRQKVQPNLLFQGFVPIFFFASFIYEFIQITVEGTPLNFYFLGITAMTLVMMFVYQTQVAGIIGSWMMIAWAAGSSLLAFIKGYVVVFDYLLKPWYFIALTFFFIGVLVSTKKKIAMQADVTQ